MKVAAIDPSFAHFGMANLLLRPGPLGAPLLKGHFIDVLDLKLVNTEKNHDKKVRRNSDDLSRAGEIIETFHDFIADCDMVFAEVPSGAQSARAAFAFGIVVGILAGCPKPLIQVQPLETKKLTVGRKTASKADMIAWAVQNHPNAPWIRRGAKLTLANEHLADAVAIAYAGVRTDQFAQLLAMMRTAA